MTQQAAQPLRWLILAGVWFIYASFGLAVASLPPLVVQIEADLNMSHSAMGSVLGAWQFVYIFTAIPCGMLLDRLGARRGLLLGALLIAASLIGRSLANDYTALLLAVMLFGVGGPVVSAGAPAVVARWFVGAERGLAMGIYSTGPAIGAIVPLVVTHSVLLPLFSGDWRAVLRLWAACAVAAGIAWFALASRSAARTVEAQDRALAALPRGEVVRELIADPAVRVVLVMGIGAFLFNHGLGSWMPELLRRGGMSTVQAGYWAAFPLLVGIGGALVIPRLAIAERRFAILIGLCLAGVAASLLLLSQRISVLFCGLFVQGIVRSALMTVLILVLIDLPRVGRHHAGTASGIFFSAAEIGGLLGPLGLGLVYDVSGGFTLGLYAFAGVSMLLALGAVKLRAPIDQSRP